MKEYIFNKMYEQVTKISSGILLSDTVYSGEVGNVLFRFPIDLITPHLVLFSNEAITDINLLIDTLYFNVLGSSSRSVISMCPKCHDNLYITNDAHRCLRLDCTQAKDNMFNQLTIFDLDDDMSIKRFCQDKAKEGVLFSNVLELFVCIMGNKDVENYLKILISDKLMSFSLNQLVSLIGYPQYCNEEDIDLIATDIPMVMKILSMNTDTNNAIYQLFNTTSLSTTIGNFIASIIVANEKILKKLSIYY
jgi:hypothetical protein